MISQRRVAFSLEHLEAEMAAFPLASEEAFFNPFQQMAPDFSGDVRFNSFWRETEAVFLRQFPSISLDELHNIRDRIWFQPLKGAVSLNEYLRVLARSWLMLREGRPRPGLNREAEKGNDTDAEARWRWRWRSFSLPPDLLLAALDSRLISCKAPQVVSESLKRILLDRQYAQVHAHIGAEIEFTDYWVGLLLKIGKDLPGAYFESPGAAFDDGKNFAAWLLRAALLRQLLGEFLAGRGSSEIFAGFLRNSVFSIFPDCFPVVIGAIWELGTARLRPGLGSGDAEVRDWYRRFTHWTAQAHPRALADVQMADPLSSAFPARSDRLSPTPEMKWIAEGLAYLDMQDKTRWKRAGDDILFRSLFWQVIRIRNLFYRYMVQRPLVSGLPWFLRFYSRIGKARIDNYNVLMESAAKVEGVRRGLRSLEVRTSPRMPMEEFRAFLHSLEELRRRYNQDQPYENTLTWNREPFEVGLVLHFVKGRDLPEKKKFSRGLFPDRWKSSSADPSDQGFRYKIFYSKIRQEAVQLGRLLLDYPMTLSLIRGVDTCTDEQGTPNWVIAPFFRYVRSAGQYASSWLGRKWGVDLLGLRATAHAGEDFVHLLSGLRRVDESIRYFHLGEDDRIGHGLSLGIDPVEWASRVGRITISKEERLFDLIWEWRFALEELRLFSDGKILFESRQKEIFRLAREVFGRKIDTIEELIRFSDQLYCEKKLREFGFPNHPTRVFLKEDDLLWGYLVDERVFRRGHDLIQVETAEEGEWLLRLQSALRKKIGRIGIAVEVNPSSNLLIGDITDLSRHPLFRLNPPHPLDDVPAVTICVGSDDPLTFATSLPQEYQLLLDTLVRNGFSTENAEAWLDRVRENSLRHRFTLPISQPVDVFTPLEVPQGLQPEPPP